MTPTVNPRPRVCAVSYLNTVPLVWGMLHGPQHEVFDLSFALPSDCADQLRNGQCDIGIVPAVEIPRQRLQYFRGTGIACHGPVRSILLISKVPLGEIRTLATDSGSRTSVMLARIVLARKHGADPRLVSRKPELELMLAEADAALIIGDPALRLNPASLPFHVADLGLEWTGMTGLPMVFAVWSGRPEIIRKDYARAFIDSARYGIAHLDDIIAQEAAARGVAPELARQYLTRHIVFELGERDYQGLDLFLQYAQKLEPASVPA